MFSCASENSLHAPSLMCTLDGQDVTRDSEQTHNQELLETGEDLYEQDTDDSESVLSKGFEVVNTAAYDKLCMEVEILHSKEEVNMRMDQT